MLASRASRALAPSTRVRASSCLNTPTPTRASRRTYATPTSDHDPNRVTIVEVGPRDGLQNEKSVIPPSVKIELIERLGRAGLTHLEAGSFVSPKWVPQMAGTAEVITKMQRLPGRHYPVLVPNMKGLDLLLDLLAQHPPTPSAPAPTNEIAIFTAATDAFSKANTNCTIAEGLKRLEPVTRKALDHGLRVRGYVSVVITCPYAGRVDPQKVKEVTKALLDMGCYEVSLGDTVGTGNFTSVSRLLETVTGGSNAIPAQKLAGHFHDTFGSAISNVQTALTMGLRTFDSAVGGLGGCPYSPGATGNVATEDILYALKDSPYTIAGDPSLEAVAEIGEWISKTLQRENASRAGKALVSAKKRTSAKL